MKKVMMLAALALVTAAMTGCCSLRTPDKPSKNNQKVYYWTFFGLSIESAVYGDGFVVKPISNK